MMKIRKYFTEIVLGKLRVTTVGASVTSAELFDSFLFVEVEKFRFKVLLSGKKTAPISVGTITS